MIRARFEFDARPLLDFQQFVEGFETVMDDLVDGVYKVVIPPMLDELGTYPNRAATLPFVWSRNKTKNEKARRYYFAAIKRGEIQTSGGRYVRTGAYGKSWTATSRKDGTRRIITVSTSYPVAKFIGGSFSRNRDFQIPGHKTTGWPRSVETVDFYLEAAEEEARNQFNRVIDERLGVLRIGRRNR
jgi:hypothetical protein